MTLALLLCLSLMSSAVQSRPDFSGVWVENEALRQSTVKADPNAKTMTLPSRPITVKQSAEVLEIQHEPPMPGLNGRRYVYDFTGKENVNRNGANTQTTRSRWEGATLVTEGTSYSETTAGEFLWKYREARRLDPRGRMTVEIRMTDASGQTSIVTRVYERR